MATPTRKRPAPQSPAGRNGSGSDPTLQQSTVPDAASSAMIRAEERVHALTPIVFLALGAAVLAIVIGLVAGQDDGSTSSGSGKASAAQAAASSTSELPAAKGRNWKMVATRIDPATSPVKAGPKTFNMKTSEHEVKVGDKVVTQWMFDDQVPGPVLRAVVGDMVTINISNDKSSKFLHSVDFHASQLTMGGGHVQVPPGKTGTFKFRANYPGVFMYHCATPPVLEHIGHGMYGMIIVQPKEGFGDRRPEFAFVQSELYSDFENMKMGTPGAVVLNGMPNQYFDEPIKLPRNANIRVFYLNAGPSLLSSPHVVGTIFDKAYEDGNPRNVSYGRQVLPLAASGSMVADMLLVDEGKYPIVTHQFDHVAAGALGVFVTGDGVPGAGTPDDSPKMSMAH